MIKTLLAVGALALATPAFATTYTLDFDGDASCTVDCLPGSVINPNYGSQPGVDVEYDGIFQFSERGSLSGLESFAFYEQGATLSFLAVNGYEVGLTSLRLGSYSQGERLGFSISDTGTGDVLVTEPVQAIDTNTGASVFTFDLTSTDGLAITLFGDFMGFGGGIDNIVYSASHLPTDPPQPTPAAVPLPAAGWMLLAGLGGMVALRRRAARA